MKVIDMVTGKIITMEMPDILREINKDTSEGWIPYDETDWREGWREWVEGEFYSALDTLDTFSGKKEGGADAPPFCYSKNFLRGLPAFLAWSGRSGTGS